TTVYHVTITYDPRDFKTSPLKIQVYPGEPPTSQGRIHLLLHTVERKPNQLLSQATITRYRQYTAGLLSVQNEGQLPDPASVPAGTLAVPSGAGRGIYVRGNTAMRWENPMVGEWHNLPYRSRARAYSRVGSFQARLIPGGIQLQGGLAIYASSSGNASRISDLPARLRPSMTHIFGALTGSASPIHARYQVGTRRDIYKDDNLSDSVPGVSFSRVIIPL